MNENPLSLPPDNHPDPDDAEGFFRRGNRHLDAGSYESAIADFSAAIQLDPTDADTYFNRGLAFRNSGGLLAALEDFHRAVEIDPVDSNTLYQRGLTFAGSRRVRSSRRRF